MEAGHENRLVQNDLGTFFDIIRGRTFHIQFLVVLFVALAVAFFSECGILFLAVVICYYVGAYTWLLVNPMLPGLLRPKIPTPVVLTTGCNVCGVPNCGRQKPTGEHQPWMGLDVPKDIDQALQDLLNKLLNEFVASWFGKFSRDEQFLWEIRERLRFACSVLLRRVLRADTGEVICERLVPIFLRHVDDYLIASDGCRTAADKLATVVSHLSEQIHPAARSRHAELEYLKAVSRTLARLGLHQPELKCKPVSILLVELLSGGLLLALSDTLCSPYIINTLLWLAAGPEKTQPPLLPSPQRVQFLMAFAARPFVSIHPVLHKNLNVIRKDQKLFYALIQYLKECGVVHLLQFCLDVENFNSSLLVPEISPVAVEALFKEARQLYEVYLKPGSPETIFCSPGVAEQFHQILSRGDDDITRLQTSVPLFQAYEETFSLLEQLYLPGFYQSRHFFQTFCSRSEPVYFKFQQKKGYEKEPLVSKLSQKLRRLVSDQHDDSSGILVDSASDATELDSAEDVDDEFLTREMSNWRISIPEVITEQDSSYRTFVFCVIRVTPDFDDDETTEVRRRFEDFYTLESKLLEFHQKLIDVLPPKRSLFDHDPERRAKFLEAYLRRLIKQPELKHSHLLHCFLRSPGEFQTALHSPYSLSNILRRSVEPMKRRKERGRHLDSFFGALLASIETHTTSELLYEISKPKKRDITKGIFGDNLAPVLRITGTWPACPARPVLRLNSFWDCLFYSMSRLFGCAQWLQRLIFGVKSSLGDAASPFIHNFINNRLRNFLIPRLPHLLRLLQGAVLNPAEPYDPAKAERLRIRVTEALTKPFSPVGLVLVRLIAPNFEQALVTTVESLQHPSLNKHLFYCLLDEVLKALFSEFSAPAH